MRGIALCLGMLLAWPLATQAAKPAEPTSIDFGAGAWVDVDATGKAHVVEIDQLSEFKDDGKPGSLADIIKQRLRERIEMWEFVPPASNGAAVNGRTHVHVSLEASTADGGGMAIRVLGAATGAKLVKRQMGELIKAMMDYGYVGRVNIDVAWKDDGSVESADSVASSVGGKVTSRSVSPKFLKTVLKAVQDWRFDPEIVEGTPIPGKGRVPINFCLSGECPAEEKTSSNTAESLFTAIDPAIGLRTAVAGTML